MEEPVGLSIRCGGRGLGRGRAEVAVSAGRCRRVVLLLAIGLILARLVSLQLVLFLATAVACLGVWSRGIGVPVRVPLILISAVGHDVVDAN